MVPRKDPAEDHGVATVDKLVDATIEILRADGQARLRVEDVLSATGLSFGTMYHHFGSRDGLVEAAVLVDFGRTNAALADAVTDMLRGSGGDAAETLTVVFTELLSDPELVALQRHRMTLFGVVAHRRETLDAMAAAEAELVAPLARFVADAQTTGALRPDLDARAVAAFVTGCGFGCTTVELGAVAQPPERWRGVVAAFVRAVVDGSDAAPKRTRPVVADPAVDPDAVAFPQTDATADDPTPRSTKERMVDAAIAIMRERGEAGLRTRDVLDATGLSVATLYHHFGSRDGLIEAATLVEYRGTVVDNIDGVRHALVDVASPTEALRRLDPVVRAVFDPGRSAWKLRRVALAAAATHRPSLRDALADAQAEVAARYADVLAESQTSGSVRSDLDPYALAVFGFAYSIGHVVTEFGPDPLPTADWVDVVDAFLRSTLAADA